MHNQAMKLIAVSIALVALAPLAAATSTPYDVLVNHTKGYQVAGTLLNPPTLSQTQGTAVIASETFDSGSMLWDVQISCVSSDTGECLGNIVS